MSLCAMRQRETQMDPLATKYMLLGRMKEDCNYFLGAGNGDSSHLWGGNVKEHIEDMKLLYQSLPKDAKPEWLTIEEIESFEKVMKTLEINKVKESVRKKLAKYGYENPKWVDDIVEIVSPGKVLLKETILGEYTGRIVELYL